MAVTRAVERSANCFERRCVRFGHARRLQVSMASVETSVCARGESHSTEKASVGKKQEFRTEGRTCHGVNGYNEAPLPRNIRCSGHAKAEARDAAEPSTMALARAPSHTTTFRLVSRHCHCAQARSAVEGVAIQELPAMTAPSKIGEAHTLS